ncbi:Acyl carrier protein [Kluyveromyces marxianus]|uniref:Acyl carrier protein n=1 Tax=Kluyveromyces marxianus TaxID=4911 RepID=A0ABX6EPI7_KLUMA|nr:acyl carrier protein [Kluyveromyces marxianus]KAG0684560.1 acyl carrier protein [Kluyveromyces marxianus]QGN13569.1 acyl carrier protein [Kluyveromyces marxianus]
MFRSVFRVAPTLTRVSGLRTGFVKPTFSSASRFYASSSLSKDEITSRIADVIKSFDKTSAASSITAETQFSKDLGLDSLDTVELLVSIEEEFDIEFPDKVADELKSVGETVDYIASNPEAN